MSVTYNLLEASGSTANTNPYTTGSIAPTSGATLYVYTEGHRTGGGTDPDSISGLSGTWTKLASTGTYNGGLTIGSLWRCTDWTGSGTLTITWPSTRSHCSWNIIEVLGNDTATAPTNIGTNNGAAGTTASATITSPASDSAVFGGCSTMDNAANIDPGSAYTEIGEALGTGTGSDSFANESEVDLTPASTTVDWSWTGNRDWGCIGWEELIAPTPPVGGAPYTQAQLGVGV